MTACDDGPDLRAIITDAIRFWEPRRIVYNAALCVVTAVLLAPHAEAKHGSPRETLLMQSVGLLILAVLANIVYCAAYVPDIVAQMSAFQDA